MFKKISKFPFYKQLDSKDCGPTCLRIISKFHGKYYSLKFLNQICETTRTGTSFLSLSKAAEQIGFRATGIKVSFSSLYEEVVLPCVIPWGKEHFVVLYKFSETHAYISDPGFGLASFTNEMFLTKWCGLESHSQTGHALLLEPTPLFYKLESPDEVNTAGFSRFYSYLKPYKNSIVYIFVGLFFSSLLQLFFPFLTQSIVDVGIRNNDLQFIYLILISQVLLFFGRQTIDIIRTWIIVNIGSRVNVSLVSDFFLKLFSLPISYFDSKRTGDIFNRIGDNSRIQELITSSSITFIFSLFNLLIFGSVLAYYSMKIFAIFFVGSFLYFCWVILFMKRRKILDYKRFNFSSDENNKIIEMIIGMQEIKLNNAERISRWSWESIQAKLFKLNIRTLVLEQVQSSGATFLNEMKNILVSLYSAKLVIDGEITLGIMLSISYIIGQLNSPISQLIGFSHVFQNAKISLERLNDIFSVTSENVSTIDRRIFPDTGDLELDNVSFRYPGTSENVFSNLNLLIPKGKVTAIVGESGCGKSTLLKILLNFYQLESGQVKVSNRNLSEYDVSDWRSKCGVVLQDGMLFSATIEENVALGFDSIDSDKLMYASGLANILEFVRNLPLGFKTRVGTDGMGLSIGQKQRILIARAVYKDPEYLFLDEATSALDSNNEKSIISKLSEFIANRTVVIIAHRLSTVVFADQIVVVDSGKIVEIGDHQELLQKRGKYFNLVKNQLDLNLIEG